MSLLLNAMERCVILTTVRTADGYGGAGDAAWERGAAFDAAIVLDSSSEERAAERQDATSLYTITTDRAHTLKYHDVFQRVSDGKVFRVTSGDTRYTPNGAALDMRQVTAEEYRLTGGING